MSETSFHIMSYKVDEAPGEGSYGAPLELADKMRTVLKAIDSETPVTVDIPNIAGATLTGCRVGRGLHLSAKIALEEEVENLDDAGHLETFLALDNDGARRICADAPRVAQSFGFDDNRAAPSWMHAMQQIPNPPFTVVIPNLHAIKVIARHPEAVDDLGILTGFFQTFIGQVLKDEGFDPADYTPIEERLSKFNARQLLSLIQTKGELPDQLIVRPGTEGLPVIYAHFLDSDQKVFTVHFDLNDTMRIDTQSRPKLIFERPMLARIMELQEQAEDIWSDVEDIREAEETQKGSRSNGTSDPLSHLYTKDDRVNIPDSISEDIRTMLGVTQG
jgi:hypothetical protein